VMSAAHARLDRATCATANHRPRWFGGTSARGCERSGRARG
jgi:hypothetical protein